MGGGRIPPKITIPPKRLVNCVLQIFSSRDDELPIHHGNFLLTDNKHGKLFVIKQAKGCKFMRKMHRNTVRLAAGLGPDPLGELMCFPGPLAAMGVPTYRGRERRGRRGATRSTQPCIPPGSLNRVPPSAGVKAGMSPLPGGR